ncbi:hypothetical protein NL676_008683 [Syzygium grande]|nr:hypothetical protein NL676_008683 [Syzygium grande]
MLYLQVTKSTALSRYDESKTGRGFLGVGFLGTTFDGAIRIIEAPSLVEAELDFDGPAKSDRCLLKEMLCKLQNSTRILIGAWCLEVMSPLKVEDMQVSLLNCKSLTLRMSIDEFSFPAIANMLATAPNLEKLVIIFKPLDFISYIPDLDFSNVDHESYWHIKKKFKPRDQAPPSGVTNFVTATSAAPCRPSLAITSIVATSGAASAFVTTILLAAAAPDGTFPAS